MADARIVRTHGLEIDGLSRDIDTILQKLSSGFRIELSIGQYIWKPENESQWHGSGDSARITLEISADGIATAKVTNPGDFRTDGNRPRADKQGWNCFYSPSVNFVKRLYNFKITFRVS